MYSENIFSPQMPQAPLAPPPVPVTTQQFSPPVVQMGTPGGLNLSKIHAFAGSGIFLSNKSWLIGEKAGAAGDMLTTSFDILQRRSILGLTIEPKNLQDYGKENEMRHYLILRRSITTVFLYIAPAGHDLYISRATTVLTSIDPFRRFLLIALAVLSVVFLLTVILLPLALFIWLLFAVFFAMSFRYWLQERDFWFYLRRRELNDFQIDDINLMEHVVDETLQVAAKHHQVDADRFKPSDNAAPRGRRIRGV